MLSLGADKSLKDVVRTIFFKFNFVSGKFPASLFQPYSDVAGEIKYFPERGRSAETYATLNNHFNCAELIRNWSDEVDFICAFLN